MPDLLAAKSPWALAESELDWGRDGPTNIGWYCTDRICRLGRGDQPALIWEDFQGNGRTFTFDQLRRRSDSIAQYLRNLGLGPGDRVCLFMDRVPELYIGFLAVLKMGGIVQPLFSAFGDESLQVRLESQGWEVEVTRVWMARARKGTHVEDGIGLTREEAIEELKTQTRVDECEGCP